ncbi:hypothetical protein G6O69_34895 [Pseudenhygromyxa sp. WMMC2535]|uniref:hypothetical protein n=1 Tax=Pseudenhygromyxa sp. WMMC2535 TaxID=2712867 RepID=UPI0015576226|nr:hypothetical protein [Pseudenhygromyxa sp. WMMC2535]NVB43063.1 hypothetical protein [Pseudenhygromyxa sp. WMMC2535]
MTTERTTPTRRFTSAAGWLLTASMGLGLGAGCDRGMDWTEFREALDEAVVQGEAQAMANDVIEISTSFTIGQAVAEAREEIRAFAESQIPCSSVTLEGETGLSIDFGELGDCSYNGKTYAGVITLDLEANADASEVIVHHGAEAFRNEDIQLDGSIDVTWGGGARKVVSDLSFSGEGGVSLEISANRTMTFIDPALGLAGGVEISGSRTWESARGQWSLDIDAVEVRGQDPVPQSGEYVLTNPDDAVVTMSFERLDEDTIQVTMTGSGSRRSRERVYEVSSTGSVDEA